jgi:hypothetical protein
MNITSIFRVAVLVTCFHAGIFLGLFFELEDGGRPKRLLTFNGIYGVILSSGTWRRLVWRIVTNISDEPAACVLLQGLRERLMQVWSHAAGQYIVQRVKIPRTQFNLLAGSATRFYQVAQIRRRLNHRREQSNTKALLATLSFIWASDSPTVRPPLLDPAVIQLSLDHIKPLYTSHVSERSCQSSGD